jgi:hypothetical protein
MTEPKTDGATVTCTQCDEIPIMRTHPDLGELCGACALLAEWPNRDTPSLGPWRWTAGDVDVDVRTYQSPGYYDNLILRGANGVAIVSGGAGEYCPIGGDSHAEMVANGLLIASAPDLVAIVERQAAEIERLRDLVSQAYCKLQNWETSDAVFWAGWVKRAKDVFPCVAATLNKARAALPPDRKEGE